MQDSPNGEDGGADDETATPTQIGSYRPDKETAEKCASLKNGDRIGIDISFLSRGIMEISFEGCQGQDTTCSTISAFDKTSRWTQLTNYTSVKCKGKGAHAADTDDIDGPEQTECAPHDRLKLIFWGEMAIISDISI